MSDNDDRRQATFRIIRFWTKFEPVTAYDEKLQRNVPVLDEDGKQKLRAVDMCEYAPIGRSIAQTMSESVSRLSKVRPIEGSDTNPAVKFANDRWNRIEPAYKAWKLGQKLPETGTPLAAWHGVTVEQADVLRLMGLRSVEEIASLSDGIVSKFPFPNGRDLQQNAIAFLKMAERNKVDGAIEAVAKENADLKDQLEQMKQILLDMQAAKAEPKPAKAKEKAAA